MNKRNFVIDEIVGLTLWWCEGTKSRKDKRWKNSYTYPLEITNTEPQIIVIFIDFLEKYYKVKRSDLKVQLQIHEGDNLKKLEQYWSNLINIPRKQFQKTIIRTQGIKIGKSTGTCKIRYNNKSKYKELYNRLTELRGVA